ncbi:phage repressor protein CI [Photobacterium ganghwense]|uniref:phage repressor protein CI n=1 Tax=Photobacterium ganghwense TaxID=320778 RepID=UPI001C2D4020|nr:phage repressor protein CI [Photobacterium ganghwense]MBV1843382.1 helix-turn-helix domain-containing protein [Photobacterium ganghwense]
MRTLQAKIAPFEYKGGTEIVERLKLVTETNTYGQLSDAIGVPRSSISTWVDRDVTPFEVVVRLHMALGVSVRWLTTGEGEPFELNRDTIESIVIERLVNGSLEEAGKITIDTVTLNKYHLQHSATKVVDEDGELHFINIEQSHATSGRYLISIDGALSINPVQRLPGKKLAVGFSGSTIDISEDDIKVLGRVAMTMSKE